MNDHQLSKRLEAAASYVKKDARLADIGSDHAYLPCFLAQKGNIKFAIAGEVVMGPFSSARKQIAESGLEDKVEARLGDGLRVINPEDRIDTATICGMGGDLIARILEAGKKEGQLEGIEHLILQPNNAEMKLRKWLLQNGYDITAEEILEENEKIYEIMTAEKKEELPSYTEEDFLFGKYLRKEKSPIFIKKWQKEVQKNLYVLDSLKHSQRDVSEKEAELIKKNERIKEAIL